MINESEVVSVGQVSRLHGKQGELQCQVNQVLWDDIETEFVVLRIDGLLVPFRVTSRREKGADSLLLRLKGIDTEAAAMSLVGSEVMLLRREVPEHGEYDPDMLTWQNLKGYQLYNADGVLMGKIASVDETTANTLCQTEEGDLFPLHEELIMALDTENKEIQLNLPDLRGHQS